MASQVKEKTKSKNISKRIQRFFREIIAELRKVVWPTRKQLINYTISVMVVSVAIGAIIWIADALLGTLIRSALLGS